MKAHYYNYELNCRRPLSLSNVENLPTLVNLLFTSRAASVSTVPSLFEALTVYMPTSSVPQLSMVRSTLWSVMVDLTRSLVLTVRPCLSHVTSDVGVPRSISQRSSTREPTTPVCGFSFFSSDGAVPTVT